MRYCCVVPILVEQRKTSRDIDNIVIRVKEKGDRFYNYEIQMK